MKKYTLESRVTGLREEFESFSDAEKRQEELYKEYILDSQYLFNICIQESKNGQDWSQTLCDKNGNPIRIIDDWFYLPINTGIWGDATVMQLGPTVSMGTQKEDDIWLWIDNGPSYNSGGQGLLSQYENASGKVLLGGLGLGMLALLLDNKPEVTEVTVVEINQNVIDAFNSNNWKTSKVNIVCADILTFEGSGYDWVLLDHYNQTQSIELYNTYLEHMSIINQNISYNNLDLFAWEDAYYYWLEQEGKERGLESYTEFANTLNLPIYSIETLNKYYNAYLSNGLPVNTNLVNALRSVYELNNE
jgi:hypothetical protein